MSKTHPNSRQNDVPRPPVVVVQQPRPDGVDADASEHLVQQGVLGPPEGANDPRGRRVVRLAHRE